MTAKKIKWHHYWQIIFIKGIIYLNLSDKWEGKMTYYTNNECVNELEIFVFHLGNRIFYSIIFQYLEVKRINWKKWNRIRHIKFGN